VRRPYDDKEGGFLWGLCDQTDVGALPSCLPSFTGARSYKRAAFCRCGISRGGSPPERGAAAGDDGGSAWMYRHTRRPSSEEKSGAMAPRREGPGALFLVFEAGPALVAVLGRPSGSRMRYGGAAVYHKDLDAAFIDKITD
jgi:hypothetical protein